MSLLVVAKSLLVAAKSPLAAAKSLLAAAKRMTGGALYAMGYPVSAIGRPALDIDGDPPKQHPAKRSLGRGYEPSRSFRGLRAATGPLPAPKQHPAKRSLGRGYEPSRSFRGLRAATGPLPPSDEGIQADWLGWRGMLARGGVIALHDSRSTPERRIDEAGSVRFPSEVILRDPGYTLAEAVDSLTVARKA